MDNLTRPITLNITLLPTQAVTGTWKRSSGPVLVLSASAIPEDAAVNTVIGALSVVNGSGSYTFTELADPDTKFNISVANLRVGAALDYETATSHSVTIRADNGAGSVIDQVFVITVSDVDEIAPTITSANSGNNVESTVLSHALTANESVTWSIIGGADQARFEISGSTLRWASNGTKDFEIPDDVGTNNTYVVDVRATDAALNTTDQTITITVTDVDDTAPTITSANSANNAEGDVLAHSLTANEAVTWSIIGGADALDFEIFGSTLRWDGNGVQDYETPLDADANNTYVVQVRATDTALNTADQTITITVTDISESLGSASLNFSVATNSMYLPAVL